MKYGQLRRENAARALNTTSRNSPSHRTRSTSPSPCGRKRSSNQFHRRKGGRLHRWRGKIGRRHGRRNEVSDHARELGVSPKTCESPVEDRATWKGSEPTLVWSGR